MSIKAGGFHYGGFQNPNYTMVPDDLFDVLAPELSGAELRVLLYIIRRTFGFKKVSDSISFSQLVDGIKTRSGQQLDRGTGLSRASVAVAVKGLADKGIVLATKNQSQERGNEPTTYSLNFRQDPWSKNQTRGGLENGLALVQKSDPQDTGLQETEEHHHDDDAVLALTKFGVTSSQARKLVSQVLEAGRGGDYIDQKLDHTRHLVEIKSPLVTRNPRGYLIRAIQEDYPAPPGYQSLEQRAAEAEAKIRKQAELDAILATQQADAEAAQRLQEEQKAKALAAWRGEHPETKIPGTELTPTAAWDMTLERLKANMSALNFTFFTDTHLLTCDASTAIVAVQNKYAIEHLQRFDRLIQKFLSDVLGSAVAVEYIPLSEISAEPLDHHSDHPGAEAEPTQGNGQVTATSRLPIDQPATKIQPPTLGYSP